MAPAIARHPGSRLLGVASSSAARARVFAEAHEVERAYESYASLLNDDDIDVVLITTPNGLHAEQVIAAAAAGKHVLCDKPLATSVADAERAVDACRDAGVKLGINFEFRHAQPFIDLREVIRAGTIGNVQTVHIESCGGVVPLAGWHTDPELAWLGVTANTGVHIYDLLRFLFGAELSEVVAMMDVSRRAAEEMETTSLALLRLDNGVLAHVAASQSSPQPVNDFVIHGSAGRIDSRGLGSLARLLRSGVPQIKVDIATDQGVETREYDVSDVFERSVAAFAQAVADDSEPSPSGTDGLISVAVLEAIVKSARDGMIVAPRSEVAEWQ
jgi:1,5-anhydro-D-fructose reductase (1,5-anhydro-D-mannitol-forming)